ncbi:MAG: glutamyl-tRNA synthetase [Promethearchaeota archaeon CR_4]|nr:MAG: glutamyl-tRNA synthetase [Candidatus Lokiarchaeota archaeon CR_4]
MCTCEAEVFRTKYKQVGVDCPDRIVSVEENLARWEKMLDGTYAEGTAVVRLKTGMQAKNPAIRDHIIMRISEAPHPRIGTKCRVWPILDFSWGIDDHLIGVTHILRGLDLQKEGEVERMIWKMMGWPDREMILYGRLNFSSEYKLSKTYQRQKIQEGEFVGWEDPRTWSMQSLAKRGIQPEALRETLLDLGLSKRGIDFDKSWVYAKNTKLIDPQSDRIFFVQNPLKMHVTGIPFDHLVAKPLINPSLPEKGTREIPVPVEGGLLEVYIAKADLPAITVGNHIRLKDLFTIEVTTMGKEIQAKFFKKELEEHDEASKIQWVKVQDNIKVKILQPDGITTTGFAEKTLATMKQGAFAQFERYGYVRIIKKQKGSIQCYFIN